MLQPIVAWPLKTFSCLVPLKKPGVASILFLVPGLGGTIEGLIELGRLLDVPFPIYAIQAIGVDGKAEPDLDVATMAARYLAEVRRLQPSGPYFLCGHSFGGLIAYEMARLLRAADEPVGQLILLDTPIHQSFWPKGYVARVFAQRLRHHAGALRAMPAGSGAFYAWRKLGALGARLCAIAGLGDPSRTDEDDLAPPLRAVLQGGLLAVARYRPPPFAGRVTYFTAEIDGPDTLDPQVLWRGRVGQLEVERAPGAHLSMLEPPYVSVLAERLSVSLRRALEEVSGSESDRAPQQDHIPAVHLKADLVSRDMPRAANGAVGPTNAGAMSAQT